MRPVITSRAARTGAARGPRPQLRCDVSTRSVRLLDDAGRPCGTIGGPATLQTPLDATLVLPPVTGPRLPLLADDAAWIAVADYGQRRVQVFETDGTLVASIDLGDEPGFGGPSRLTWRAPVLEVEGVDGRRVSIYLAAALLASRDRRPAAGSSWGFGPAAREAVN